MGGRLVAPRRSLDGHILSAGGRPAAERADFRRHADLRAHADPAPRATGIHQVDEIVPAGPARDCPVVDGQGQFPLSCGDRYRPPRHGPVPEVRLPGHSFNRTLRDSSLVRPPPPAPAAPRLRLPVAGW